MDIPPSVPPLSAPPPLTSVKLPSQQVAIINPTEYDVVISLPNPTAVTQFTNILSALWRVAYLRTAVDPTSDAQAELLVRTVPALQYNATRPASYVRPRHLHIETVSERALMALEEVTDSRIMTSRNILAMDLEELPPLSASARAAYDKEKARRRKEKGTDGSSEGTHTCPLGRPDMVDASVGPDAAQPMSPGEWARRFGSSAAAFHEAIGDGYSNVLAGSVTRDGPNEFSAQYGLGGSRGRGIDSEVGGYGGTAASEFDWVPLRAGARAGSLSGDTIPRDVNDVVDTHETVQLVELLSSLRSQAAEAKVEEVATRVSASVTTAMDELRRMLAEASAAAATLDQSKRSRHSRRSRRRDAEAGEGGDASPDDAASGGGTAQDKAGDPPDQLEGGRQSSRRKRRHKDSRRSRRRRHGKRSRRDSDTSTDSDASSRSDGNHSRHRRGARGDGLEWEGDVMATRPVDNRSLEAALLIEAAAAARPAGGGFGDSLPGSVVGDDDPIGAQPGGAAAGSVAGSLRPSDALGRGTDGKAGGRRHRSRRGSSSSSGSSESSRSRRRRRDRSKRRRRDSPRDARDRHRLSASADTAPHHHPRHPLASSRGAMSPAATPSPSSPSAHFLGARRQPVDPWTLAAGQLPHAHVGALTAAGIAAAAAARGASVRSDRGSQSVDHWRASVGLAPLHDPYLAIQAAHSPAASVSVGGTERPGGPGGGGVAPAASARSYEGPHGAYGGAPVLDVRPSPQRIPAAMAAPGQPRHSLAAAAAPGAAAAIAAPPRRAASPSPPPTRAMDVPTTPPVGTTGHASPPAPGPPSPSRPLGSTVTTLRKARHHHYDHHATCSDSGDDSAPPQSPRAGAPVAVPTAAGTRDRGVDRAAPSAPTPSLMLASSEAAIRTSAAMSRLQVAGLAFQRRTTPPASGGADVATPPTTTYPYATPSPPTPPQDMSPSADFDDASPGGAPMSPSDAFGYSRRARGRMGGWGEDPDTAAGSVGSALGTATHHTAGMYDPSTTLGSAASPVGATNAGPQPKAYAPTPTPYTSAAYAGGAAAPYPYPGAGNARGGAPLPTWSGTGSDPPTPPMSVHPSEAGTDVYLQP